MASSKIASVAACYHCGQDCDSKAITAGDKHFCCQGCLSVYEILSKTGMCNYYEINRNPGSTQKITARPDKFAFLDDASISQALISYRDERQTHAGFYLPHIHCSSCLWLLEHLHSLNNGIISSKVNFARKEVAIVFDHRVITLRAVAELLTSIGYEPYISLQHLSNTNTFFSRSKIVKLGIAGFCFANIMLFSFPEYLGIGTGDHNLVMLFRYLNLALSLPVLLYSSSEFYLSAWKSLRQRFLNIDVPIVLAVMVTFTRSVYEISTGTGSGYFDSMSGIVFFMLIGRVLQDKTYAQLNFERDYTSYFPVAVTRIHDGQEQIVTLPDIRLNDTLLLHSQELIPADGILTKGRAMIDYSFVTGESIPVIKEMGEIIYAGGRQLEANIEMLVIKEVNQGYLTRLWNNNDFSRKPGTERSFVNLLSRYFTLFLFAIALLASLYWYYHDASRIWNVVTAILIVACPCALLISNTFTNGNILRILGRNGLYLRNAQVIENISKIDHIVFDKTGTLTVNRQMDIRYEGKSLPTALKYRIASLANQSTHPVSRALASWLGGEGTMDVLAYKETPGMGIEGIVGNDLISIGSAKFITGQDVAEHASSSAYISVEGKFWGVCRFKNHYRDEVPAMLQQLQRKHHISVLSGDNDSESASLKNMLGNDATLLFSQSPEEKLQYIRSLQSKGHQVMMVGDGLNDAGALKQADIGMAVAENNNQFTPASDSIVKAEQLPLLTRFMQLCRTNRKIVLTAFIVSILYNIIGLFFAVQGMLSPMIAAILMPASSLSILLISFGISGIAAKKLQLS